ncbi:hypothetical protein SAMD00019534_015470 [Acytostelium subglobosum LB1]|uniref:hypothetical protein n=1 Tax=Acytostelium subglobosum LB1 TaxID=1410327 RepID=UPI000644A984|nr:hypothetical protein SAMD00019534_015470 [Acytostelium subglobosum LB1]GAM18372.1 hypothetical protein SAMD00019534_015470 [Acytostelium subglobosum LB1]|eukprot:XP_012757592.1 hypothetical protein SAMD00019534_015470 [Acytostelium subglobosum LB1]
MIVKFKNRIKATDKVHNATARKDIPLLEIAKLKVQSKTSDLGYLGLFDTPFARIMPFIISRGRKMIGTIIKDDIDCIKRVHTDGFVSTKPWTEKTGKKSLDYPKLGKECGDLRYEGFCPDAIVKNMTKVNGKFIV